MTHLLHIEASPRQGDSVSRALAEKVKDRFNATSVKTRAVWQGIPQLDAAWIGANFTPQDARDDAQRAALALSDELIAELKAADVLVISTPVWNFGIPAALKAWVDQIARAGVTFRYTENGPVGLLEGKRAVIAVASGGTEVGSQIDFASGYLRHVLGFIGIHDVEIVAADRLMLDAEASHAKADAAIAALAA